MLLIQRSRNSANLPIDSLAIRKPNYIVLRMSSKSLVGAFVLAPFVFSSFVVAAPDAIAVTPSMEGLDEEVKNDLPSFDLARISFLQTGAMDFEDADADLTLSQFEFRSFFAKPIELFEGLSLIPLISYRFTDVDLDGINSPILHDEALHSISLSSILFKNFEGTSWFAAGWTRAELATDFQSIDSDSFTYDVAAGVGYRFSDTFTLAVGAAVLNINSDVQVYPGINFDWKPNECIQVGLYGPSFRAAYEVNERWNLAVRGMPTGGSWVYNTDFDITQTLDITSYTLGLYTENNIFGNFWLSAGVGYSFLGNLEVRDNDGSNGVDTDLDGAPFAEVAIGLRRW